MRPAAVGLAAALLIAGLAGCGSGSSGATERHFASLCVDAGLPLSGPEKAAGEGVLAGLRSQVPRTGLRIGGYRVRLCQVFDDAKGVVTHVRQAAESVRTIAYVGELSAGRAGMAETVLAQAGIALITPTGPVPTPVTGPPVASATTRSTALYLLPSTRTQADAVAALRKIHDCARRRGGRPRCSVVSSQTAPLCTGIAPTGASAAPRFCVLAGPDLSNGSGWSSPAVAYGDSAGRLLVASLRASAAHGRDVADRAVVLGALSRADLSRSPIGALRFDSAGGMEANLFAAYTVTRGGRIVLSQSLHAH